MNRIQTIAKSAVILIVLLERIQREAPPGAYVNLIADPPRMPALRSAPSTHRAGLNKHGPDAQLKLRSSRRNDD